MSLLEIAEGLLVLAVATVPFLGGARATVDPEDGHYSRTSPARAWTRAMRRSGTAGADSAPRSPAPAPSPDGRGVSRGHPTAAPAGLHRGRPR